MKEGDFSFSEIGFADRVKEPKPPPSLEYDDRGVPLGSFSYGLDMSPDPDPKTFTPMRPEFKKFEKGGLASLAPIARTMFRGPRALQSLAPVARNMDRSMLRSG